MGFEWLKENAKEEASLILIINDDVTFEPDYLARAVSFLAEETRVFLLSRFSCEGGGRVDETGVIADLRRLTFMVARPGEKVNCLSTRGLFAWWKDLKFVGDFRPKLLPHYLSDFEYTLRAGKMGIKLVTTSSVYLCPDLESTGHRGFTKLPLPSFLEIFFSKKSAANPFYWSVFVILAVPIPWVLPGLLRVWYRATMEILRQCHASMGNLTWK